MIQARDSIGGVVLKYFVALSFLASLILTLTPAVAQQTEQSVLSLGCIPKAAIVYDPDPANWREKLAVKDLAEYLSKSVGMTFPVLISGQETDSQTCIYVNRVAAVKLGIDQSKLAPEEWIVKSVGNDIMLTGGTGDGFMYAVYHFLEDVVGIHWWSGNEESVPNRPDLTVGPLNLSGKPAFNIRWTGLGYSDLPGNCARESTYALRNRTEYWYKIIPNGSYQWNYHYKNFAMPWCHTMFSFVPPRLFDTHPEWFAMLNGKRGTDARDLCMTNTEARKYMASAIVSSVDPVAADADAKGNNRPYVFMIGREDGSEWCQCDVCTKYYQEHSKSDLMVEFVNATAEELAKTHPNVLVALLSYQGTAAPPKSVKPLDNVLPIYCTEGYNQARPITDPCNKATLDNIKGWKAVSKNLMLYVYQRTFAAYESRYGASAGLDLPCPTVLNYGENLKLFKELGIYGIYNQLGELIHQDNTDMKNWILAKLMEDPDQDFNKLLGQFVDGYYGPASKDILDYLNILKDAEQKNPSSVWFFSDITSRAYFNMDFFTAGDVSLKKAEELAKDWHYRVRVGYQRLSFDRAMLYCWPKLVREWVTSGKKEADFPFDKSLVLKRYETNTLDQMELRGGYGGIDMGIPNQQINEEREIFARKIYVDAPIPEKFKSLGASVVSVFPAASGSYRLGKNATVVDDPKAATGKALKVTLKAGSTGLGWKYQPQFGDAIAGKEAVALNSKVSAKSNGYHWMNLGNQAFDASGSGLILGEGETSISFWASELSPATYEVWVELRSEPAKSGPSVYISQLVTIKK